MKSRSMFVFLAGTALLLAASLPAAAQSFNIALPTHRGELEWQAAGFRIAQSSAKPNNDEIGIRGKNEADGLAFLGFLFTVAGEPRLTSAKYRDGAMAEAKREAPSLEVLANSEIAKPGKIPVELVSYRVATGKGRFVYSARAFAAKGDLCGDLEIHNDAPLNLNDARLNDIFRSYHLNPNYEPQFRDVFLYAQTLYDERVYKSAGPLFELALAKIPHDSNQVTMTRVLTDQAGMSYGISGDLAKSRAIFEAAIAKDPSYPLYYYNLACADAEEGKLADARVHLQEAFARKSNVIAGESMPDPSKDDSFLPYRNNKSFWTFIESLH